VTLDEIRAAVLDALGGVAPEADASALDPEASLREELELDSMDHLNFLIALHEALGVEIPEADYPRLQTLNQVVAYLAEKLAVAGGSRSQLTRPE
jgi:acyl carrier protein